MKIQFLSWYTEDIELDNSTKFVIYGFGKTFEENSKTICIIIRDYYPTFYLQLNENEYKTTDENKIKQMSILEWKDKFNSILYDIKALKKNKSKLEIKKILKKYNLKNTSYILADFWDELLIDDIEYTNSHIFIGKGYENYKKYPFLKVSFTTYRAFRFFNDFFSSFVSNYIVYESNLNPLLKFFHECDLKPSGWIELDLDPSNPIFYKKKAITNWSKCEYEYSFSYYHINKSVKIIDEPHCLWFKLLGYDLECHSSHGDFPCAKKDLSKWIREIKSFIINNYNSKSIYYNDVNIGETIYEDCKTIFQSNTKYFSRIFLKINLNFEDIFMKKDVLHYINNIIELTYNRSKQNFNNEILDLQLEKFHQYAIDCVGDSVEGDPIIQIGNIIEFPKGVYQKVIFCLKETKSEFPTDIIVYSYDTEKELIENWIHWFEKQDPDILMGYNIYNFDNEYLWIRAEENKILKKLQIGLSRVNNVECQLKDMTKGHGKFLQMNGREILDLNDIVKKNYSLDSYTLDNVVSKFIRGKITEFKTNENKIILQSYPIGLFKNDYFKIIINNGIFEDKLLYQGHSKFIANEIGYENDSNSENIFIQTNYSLNCADYESKFIKEWCLSKDDITPQQIFQYQNEDAYKRFLIAKYCIQDCLLCHYLFAKLEILINYVSMANVCYVPFGYLFLRGQSVKIFSLIARECMIDNYRIPVLKPNEDVEEEEFYEGALVLEPEIGIYIDEPITVNDFNSLYPSCGISHNISPDSQILNPEYDNLPNVEYNVIEFDEYEYQYVKGKSGKVKKNKEPVVIGKKICKFVVYPEGKKAIVPKIWQKLLNERKNTRKKMENEKDHFKKVLLDGLQLAFKLSANSMYGIFGFNKSPLYYKDVAASITATGRNNLMFSKNYIETNYPGSRVVYGDTDSLFVSFPSNKTNLDKIYDCIDISTEAGDNVSSLLKPPHNLGFEKCISPFILINKKKYTGLYYTSKTPKCYMNTMGFVLKRRDNAIIVKEIIGNAVKKILYDKDINGSIKYVQNEIQKMLLGGYPIDKFIITKTLKDNYANPYQIAHYMLSERIGERDIGKKPKVGSRIPFVYIKIKETINTLQSDRIECPQYIIENEMIDKIDYLYYFEHQLKNPLLQLYELIYGDKAYNIIFGDIMRKFMNKRNQYNEITYYLNIMSQQQPIIENEEKLEKIKQKHLQSKNNKKIINNKLSESQKKITLFLKH
jgi:DNA polymerase elongation subunit (family B)